jgi:peptide methionine sulfoxide reductase msrA/msrB
MTAVPAMMIMMTCVSIFFLPGVQAVEFNELTAEEQRVILQKGTERPFTGEYWNHKADGTYICRRCNTPLYRSGDKFDSGCGWPSFDDELPGTVKRLPDPDGRRTEIVCAACDGHLGHVFKGERMTAKNTRHCVNSVSIRFVPANEPLPEPTIARAIFAGGCFWGVEYFMKQVPGVIRVTSGYTGGRTEHPTYKEVCSKDTGHAEAVEVVFDPGKTDFETLAKRFFETHDPTQVDRQGPDIGSQYRSEIFYVTDEQKTTAEKLIRHLEEKGLTVATKVTRAGVFWPAEDYHQDYYQRKGSQPYCHAYVKRF